MNVATMPKVTNAVIVRALGVMQTPNVLQRSIDHINSYLENKDAPYGSSFGCADMRGRRMCLCGITIIKSKVPLFLCLLGISPKELVVKLHAAKFEIDPFLRSSGIRLRG